MAKRKPNAIYKLIQKKTPLKVLELLQWQLERMVEENAEELRRSRKQLSAVKRAIRAHKAKQKR